MTPERAGVPPREISVQFRVVASMKPEITEEPRGVRLRTLHRPGTWHRLSLLEKIAVVQLVMAGCTFLLLVLLVGRS